MLTVTESGEEYREIHYINPLSLGLYKNLKNYKFKNIKVPLWNLISLRSNKLKILDNVLGF